MNDANDNPFPSGRWTSKTAAPAPNAFSLPAAAEILSAPLRELFWGLPESSLVEEARARVDRAVAAALVQSELHLA
jgi:hypothetical protein